MKYKGRKLEGPRVKVVPLLREPNPDGTPGTIFIQVQAVVDMDPFYAMCPQPSPPILKLPGGKTRANVEDEGYKKEVDRWWAKRSAWTALTSLSATKDLEWEQVKMDDPDTWELYSKELASAGFADNEIARIVIAISEVNGLNEGLIEEARQSFLIGQAEQLNGHSSQKAGASITPSGAPASK